MRHVSRLTLMVISMSALISLRASADESEGYVSLILSRVSAERGNERVITITCEVVLENRTGNEVHVISNFESQLDGIDIVVTNDDGQILVQRPYTYHQSPMYDEGKTVAIKKGRSSLTLVFPVRGIDPEIGSVRVRLAGQLTRSSYRHVCSTETKNVVVRQDEKSKGESKGGGKGYNESKPGRT